MRRIYTAYLCLVITSPKEVEKLARAEKAGNEQFRVFLRGFRSADIDSRVNRLYKEVAAQVDCLECGNCCKKLVPVVRQEEIARLAELKNTGSDDFINGWLLFDQERDTYTLKSAPCTFLQGNCCTVYEDRPMACHDYPHLQHPDFKYRKSVWYNYTICPIVFNVVQLLKSELQFNYTNPDKG